MVRFNKVFKKVVIIPGLLLAMTMLCGCDNSNGKTVEHLGDLTAAVYLYYGEHNCVWPPTLDSLIPKYISSIPNEEITKTNRVVTSFDGKGGWLYDRSNGSVKINLEFKRSK